MQIVFKKSPPLLKFILLLTILICSGCLIFIRVETNRLRAETEALRQEGVVQEQEIAELKKHISQLGTVQGIRHIAENELNLVSPDTIFFVPTDSTGK